MAKVRVLIVEDDPLFAIDAEMIVEELGYALAETVDNSLEAQQIIKEQSPDLILMDVTIKGPMNGIELALSIRDFDIPIIFLTAHADKQVYEEAKLAMPYAFIIKPFDKLTLQSTIESVLLHKGTPHATAELLQAWKEGAIINESLFVKNNNKLFKVNIPCIRVIEADGNYSLLNTAEKKYAVKISLKQLKNKLSSRLFVQVHRNYVVQISHIESIDLTAGEVQIGGKSYPIGGKYKNHFIERLNRV
ncbi:MAG: hypothetical protein DHS20C18_41060 [Saprospiraceae bacterium]|nr:MAG: hypothetical protein DHS20C18_41060 [Saprospiraceae bacterium]